MVRRDEVGHLTEAFNRLLAANGFIKKCQRNSTKRGASLGRAGVNQSSGHAARGGPGTNPQRLLLLLLKPRPLRQLLLPSPRPELRRRM